MNAPTVEHEGTHVRLRAIAFGTHEIIERGPQGFVAFRETWDANSIEPPKMPMRLLIAHDRRMPIGWLESADVEPDGVWMNGRLVGSPEALASVRALASEQLRSQVSVGFHADRQRDVWVKPEPGGTLASVSRRGACVVEVSLVDTAAVKGSHLASITTRPPGLSRVEGAAGCRAAPTALGHRRTHPGENRRHRRAGRTRAAATPSQAQVLADARAAVHAGQRWHVPAEHATAAPSWDERCATLLARELDPHDRYAVRAWEAEMGALLDEPH